MSSITVAFAFSVGVIMALAFLTSATRGGSP
jgi:hypothetical protein